MEDLNSFPRGAVLVARHDASGFVKAMPYAAAIITDTGSPTSHMASLSREFRVPTVVNTGDATRILRHGRQITVHAAGDGVVTVYDGIDDRLVAAAAADVSAMDGVYEYRKKRYVLRHISRLNLIDPLQDDFSPEGCKTMHDILRFIHEKAVAALVDNAGRESSSAQGPVSVGLELSVPAGIRVIDIGGAVGRRSGKGVVGPGEVTSIPLGAVIRGITHPGVWHAEAVPLKAGDFLASLMRMPDIAATGGDYLDNNVAVASAEYLNLGLKFGYHYALLDCYCSSNARNNHLYFRFAGGATNIVKRSRRSRFIARLLKDNGFVIGAKGDVVSARLANIRQEEMVEMLELIGRLLAYTRQLDAVMQDDSDIERYASNFREGIYEL